MENSTIHNTYSNQCAICECPVGKLGEPVSHPLHNHHQYSKWVQKLDKASLHKYSVKFVNNALVITKNSGWRLRRQTPWMPKVETEDSSANACG